MQMIMLLADNKRAPHMTVEESNKVCERKQKARVSRIEVKVSRVIDL